MRLGLYRELARYGWRRQTSYRAATLAGMFTNSVFALVQGAVLVAALHAAHGSIGGYDERDALTYVWLAQALIGPLAIFGGRELADRIRTGDVATDFARPVTLPSWWLATDIGRAGSAFVFRAIPQFLVGALLFSLLVPTSASRWLAVAASAWLAVVVSFALHMLGNLAVFWTVEPRGPLAAQTLLLVGLSGMLLPLSFFPTPAYDLLRVLPWAAAVQGPVDVFLGHGSTPATLGLQALWAVALMAATHAVARAAHHKLVVQGG